MVYNILANKWRPKNFIEICGQSEPIFFLKESIIKKNIHHSYLITGNHGIGKTSIARIFAKCINCHKEINIIPCEKCDSCIEINNGKNIDVIELDAASKTKVEDIRDIIESSKYTTTHSRHKIYIIDEAQMLSINSFNALLKTLEEPTKNTKFILVTTNPNKIPLTIKSRCINIELQNISKKDIINRIKFICEHENIKYDKKSLYSIINFSDGSLRDILNIIEKFISQNNTIINSKNIKKILGISNEYNISKLLSLINKNKNKKIIHIINKLYKENISFEKVLKQLQILINKIIIFKLTHAKTHSKKTSKLIKNINIKKLKYFYKKTLLGNLYLNNSPNKKIGFELLIISMTKKAEEKIFS